MPRHRNHKGLYNSRRLLLHNTLRREFVNLLGDTILRNDIKMYPSHSFFKTNRTGQFRSVLLNLLSGIFGTHSNNSKIPSLAKNVARKIRTGFATNDRTAITSKPALSFSLPVAVHRFLKNITPDDEQRMQIIRVQELPRLIAPFGIDMRTYKFIDVEIWLDRRKYFFSCHI